MGILTSGLTCIYEGIRLIIHNALKSESIIKKNFNAIADYAVHESVEMIESLTGHIGSEDNSADLLTKVVIGQKGMSLKMYDSYNKDTKQWSRTKSRTNKTIP